MVRLPLHAEGERGAAPLLDEVRKCHDASLRGDHYDSFQVNSKNFMDKSDQTLICDTAVVSAGDVVSMSRLATIGHNLPLSAQNSLANTDRSIRKRAAKSPVRRLLKASNRNIVAAT
jgi:hypothetical protein